MNNFQTILVAIFLAFFVFGVMIFSGLIKLPGSTTNTTANGRVVIWGTFPKSNLAKLFDNLSIKYRNLSTTYVQKNSTNYQQDLIEAFANGNGPDLFIITPDMIKKNDNFIYKTPYTDYAEKLFRDNFIDGADIYLDSKGIIAIPITVDPIVMYYNKDILANEGIVSPVKTWDELFNLNSVLTKRDSVGSGIINQSMIALGQYVNVNNAKDIIATLLLQNNNPIVTRGGDSGYLSVINNNSTNSTVSPLQAVLKFFTAFSSPSDTSYSWNRSLPNSFDMFTSGKLAFYLGYASELFSIESTNPNLSFDVTQVPQIKDTTIKRTFGNIYAIAINNRSTNMSSATIVRNYLTGSEGSKEISVSNSLPPASRTLLADKPTDIPYLFTFYNSALITRSWLDPDKVKSSDIFGNLIESILSNKSSEGDAINKAQSQLQILLK